jgi:uncharacterized membrane protein
MRRSLKIWLIFGGVFLAGGVAGGFVSLRVAKTMIERGRGSEQFAPSMMNRLTEGLNLTEGQQAKVRPLVDKAWEELRRCRKESIDAMKVMETSVTQLLTDEQKATYNAMQEEQRLRWQKSMERREQRRREREGDGGEAGDHPPQPPPPDGATATKSVAPSP